MGMYTQLVLGVNLKSDTPTLIIQTLQHMVGDLEEMDMNPYGKLFSCARWQHMLLCDSYYFDWDSQASFKRDSISDRWCLVVVSNLKNYDNEIDKFLDWIAPYLETQGFLGFSRYEECLCPTLLYNEGGRIRRVESALGGLDDRA